MVRSGCRTTNSGTNLLMAWRRLIQITYTTSRVNPSNQRLITHLISTILIVDIIIINVGIGIVVIYVFVTIIIYIVITTHYLSLIFNYLSGLII